MGLHDGCEEVVPMVNFGPQVEVNYFKDCDNGS